jgi:protein TonB
MFESTLSAQGLNESERRLGPVSAAVIGHLAFVLAVVAVTAMIVPPVPIPDPPEHPVWIAVLPPKLDLGSPPPGVERPRRGSETSTPQRSITPPPIQNPTPPVQTPDALPSTDDVPPTDGSGVPGDGSPGPLDGSGLDAGADQGGGGGGGGGGDVDPVVITADMIKPTLLVKVEPTYPNVARIARLSGRVTISAVIGLDGNVESAEVLASTSSLFSDTAIAAVRKWRYRPALMNGKPVRVYFTVVVDFSLR